MSVFPDPLKHRFHYRKLVPLRLCLAFGTQRSAWETIGISGKLLGLEKCDWCNMQHIKPMSSLRKVLTSFQSSWCQSTNPPKSLDSSIRKPQLKAIDLINQLLHEVCQDRLYCTLVHLSRTTLMWLACEPTPPCNVLYGTTHLSLRNFTCLAGIPRVFLCPC